MDLIDKLAFWMEGGDTVGLFSEEERNLLAAIDEFGEIRKKEQDGGDANAIFSRLEREREISFRLKSLLFSHIDRLLAGGSIQAWG